MTKQITHEQDENTPFHSN